ncbi:DUF881 domain-containing protein [Nocardioides sp. Y6]|uniref:DUF881 domain-containing protein n=1 Tax=Nocardioides malaquae TaxID=2773426 RepID=A0ABR9RSD5_9ACTN|nr:DUF881 domain-containing protein [Nocardioides malaquae]MBE7324488.1 DUF881 domain-containing protein [Nocardioides malaquae]
MTEEPRVSPTRRAWRVATPMILLLSGTLFVVSAQNSDGGDLRPTRYTDIASIVEAETAELERLTEEAARLDAEVAALARAYDDRDTNRYNRRIEKLLDPTGYTAKSGTAVTVTLTDAPEDLIREAATNEERDKMVVHQQDIQAVVNAMWRAGAEAVTIQGKRVIATTGIKCSGNTVQLQGLPYSPPYVITAIGDQLDIFSEIQADDYVSLYREDSTDPEIAVGYEIELVDHATAPAYDVPVNLSYAEPMES